MECEIARMTFGVRAYREYLQFERGLSMDWLDEKLTRAGGVVERQTKAIGEDADALIAREDEFVKKRKEAFGAHHQVLDAGWKGLEALERKLDLVSNGPLPSSGSSSQGQDDPDHNTRGSDGEIIHKG